MFRRKRYIFNERTLSYEWTLEPVRDAVLRWIGIVAAGAASYFLYFYLFFGLLGIKPVKTSLMEAKNRNLIGDLEYLSQEIDVRTESLAQIQRRDNVVYRPVFGMDEISEDVRSAGFGGVDRYSKYADFPHGELMAGTEMKMDILSKRVYVQSRSFDDVELLAKRAGDMASCVPSINPVAPIPRNHISSSFGYRIHPIRHTVIFHEGIDISGNPGEPVFVTGDGTVESVARNFFGYGNTVVIDHGFGYKTRYAHLKEILVTEGQHIVKGTQIATMGNSGLSTGNHLHYEVIYMGKHINPWNFLDSSITPEEYKTLVKLSDRKR